MLNGRTILDSLDRRRTPAVSRAILAWRLFEPKRLGCGLAAVLGLESARSVACAGLSAPLMPLLGQAGGAESTGPNALDWGIVVVLIAAALFAVCRSGRRN
jgi:hypothetical protein